jgi:hypothetical protein
MTLSDTGESRVRGYLYVLERSLRASVSPPLAADAVREVESHIRDRVAESPGMPNEREALEAILIRLGSPGTVARAYSLEMMMEEAAVGGRAVAVLRSLFQTAAMGGGRFFTSWLLFMGYASGVAFVAMSLLKPIFPNNVGLWVYDGGVSLGAQFPAPPGVAPLGGYWIIPILLGLGVGMLVLTHLFARRWISRIRTDMSERRA